MSKDKFRSVEYLEWLATKRCVISYSRDIELHHEAVVPKFSGMLKRRFDYGAIPLSRKLHQERHAVGRRAFWEKYRKNPASIAKSLLTEYIKGMPSDIERALEALRLLEEVGGSGMSVICLLPVFLLVCGGVL